MFDWLTKRRKASEPEVDRRTSLAARPVRHRLVKWEETDEGVVLHVPLRKLAGGKRGFFAGPESKDIVLDEIGAGIWKRCDGEHTTADLLAWLRERWQWSWKEAELGLTNYLKTLGKRGVVIVAPP